MRFALTSALVLLLAASASARIINVPADYATIQAGIDASINGDTVLVGPGEYTEIISLSDRNILLTSSNGPDVTIIHGSCQINGFIDSTGIIRGFSFPYTTQSSPIIAIYGASIKIEGNVIRNGYAPNGAGIMCWHANPIIRNNIIANNYAELKGGGIDIWNDYDSTGIPEISYNIISRNRTGFRAYGYGKGGGISVIGNAIIKFNIIYDNQSVQPVVAGGSGGGIILYQCYPNSRFKSILLNNTIVNNIAMLDGAHGSGGGIYISSCSGLYDSLYIANNIIAFNTWGHNIYSNIIGDSMYLYWDYNLVFGDTVSRFPHGQHDIYLDPLFADTVSDNYQLLSNSPCIDAGDPNSPLDPDSTRADIGAYFYDQMVNISDPSESVEPFSFQLFQNYPNPFNSNTIISYNLDIRAYVNLQVYSVSGQLIRDLINDEPQESGEHRIIWNAKNRNGKEVATGIYIYRLSVDGNSVSRAMITIR